MTDLHAGGQASATAAALTESVIREMTRLALQHNAINLAQGFPDFPAPDQVKQAAVAAIEQDLNQYPITWGQVSIREALADKYREHYGMVVDPERDVCVTCGATEAMIAAMIGCVDPGQEVIVFEPFYENYGAAAAIAGAVPRYVTLREPGWSFDEAELAAAFTSRTRAIVINTPGNPTGKVFSAEELGAIARLCQRHGVLAITDEIYEHIVYDGARHIPMATVAGMEDRTITISALSKSYAVTRWRGGRGAPAPPAGLLLRPAGRRLHRAARPPAADPGHGRARARDHAGRGVLHHVRRVGAGPGRRHRDGARAHPRGRRRHRAGLVVLLPARAWPLQDPVLLQQEADHAARGGQAARAVGPGTHLTGGGGGVKTPGRPRRASRRTASDA